MHQATRADREPPTSRPGLAEIYVAAPESGSDLAANIAAAVASFTASAGAMSLVVRLLGRVLGRRGASGR